MKISTLLSYASGFRKAAAELAELERAGLDLVWVPEAYSLDAPSFMGYIAALTKTLEIGSGIMPIYSRTPALIAMTAAGVDTLSEGRFHLGLGSSGPQVIEGWHGVPFNAPIGRTREIVDICRNVWAREGPLVYEGRYYRTPLPPNEGTGLGKPLKIIARPVRPTIPIWIAALGEKNVSMAAEMADGWIPLLYIPERAREVWGPSLDRGLGKRAAALGTLQIATGGLLAIGEGDEAMKVREQARPALALYLGGMGAKGKNFYIDTIRRYGFEETADRIQDLYLEGKITEAEAIVPDELLEGTSLCGPQSYVAERIAAYKEAGVTHLQVNPVPIGDQRTVELIAKVKELVG